MSLDNRSSKIAAMRRIQEQQRQAALDKQRQNAMRSVCESKASQQKSGKSSH